MRRRSSPAWGCGLKYYLTYDPDAIWDVVPCVGTCAEISIAPETSSVGLAVGSFPLFAAFKHAIYTSSKFEVFTLTNQALACYNSRCVI